MKNTLILIGFIIFMSGTCDYAQPRTIRVPVDFSAIQVAIDAAEDGDEIVVSPSIYYENINFGGKNIVLRSTDPTNPNVVAKTIIDGNQNGSVVIFSGGETADCVLSGFTVKNGNNTFGGGIACINSSPTIQNCIITENVGGWGAGIDCGNSSARITNCIIKENTRTSTEPGGGIYFRSFSPIGEVPSDNPYSPIVINSIITENTGAGIYTDNIADFPGNPLVLTVINCTITKNKWLGGIFCWTSTSLIIRNSILWNPQAFSEIDFTYFSSPSSLTISYSNIKEGIKGIDTGEGACILDWGEGNISNDPKFVDADNGNFHLRPDSPCIDIGCFIEGLTKDIESNPRPSGSGFDIGAYEYIAQKTAVKPTIWILYQ